MHRFQNRMRRFGRSALPTACSNSLRTGNGAVMEVAESFPCRLLLLAKDRPEMDSSERRTVVAEIAAGDFDASSAVGKLKTLFGPEIEHARFIGGLCPVLFQH